MTIIGVAIKAVDLRPEFDPLTGAVYPGGRIGASEADQAALEWALRLAETWGGTVVAASAGAPRSDVVLREALATGADAAIRVELPRDAPSPRVAAGLAEALAAAEVILCGDWSLDAGSGSVPGFIAAERGAAQALGMVSLSASPSAPGVVDGQRRLDGGRRERLRVRAPSVVSVESGAARLRRAPLTRVLAARRAEIRVVPVSPGAPPAPTLPVARTSPYRPRARALPPPPPGLSARERVLALTGALAERQPAQVVRGDAGTAADALLEYLDDHGYR